MNALFGVVKLTGQSPDEVRRWAAGDVVHLLAHNALEVEAIEGVARGQTPRTGPSAAREAKSITYRVRPRAKE